jgi:hypothetical protein
MRKLPSSWSIICTDNVCWAITTSAPLVLFIGLAVKITGTVPGRVNFAFLRSSRTPRFSEGTQIPVLVDPANPKRVIPLELYAGPGAPQNRERPISPEHRSTTSPPSVLRGKFPQPR